MRERENLVVGGLAPFTTIDFPGHLAAVVFCQGCPWRCGYCHNPHLLPTAGPMKRGAKPWPDILDWLETRRGLLDGVVFSGGEPLLQRALPAAAAAVRRLGFAVALHTGGAYPERLRQLLPLVDWVGFDVKTAFDDYGRVTGVDSGAAALASLKHLLSSGVANEIRCTVDAEYLGEVEMGRMARQLHAAGVRRLVLQSCRREGRPVAHPAQSILDVVSAAGMHVELRAA